MEVDCQCGAHTHTHAGCSGSDHKTHAGIVPPVLSAVLLLGGILLRQAESLSAFFRPLELYWFLVAYLPVGAPVVREAWKSLRRKEMLNEFSLMTLASAGAFFIGEYPEAVAVMLFYSLGEMLQHKAVDRSTRHIRRLLDVRPPQAQVWREGGYRSVSPATVVVGETIEVKPGERVPLDGVLEEDKAVFDTSALTGESMPRTVSHGGEVLAGMIAQGQAVRIRVTKPYDQSTLARILLLVREAAERKAPAERFIRRFARIYTPIVAAGALLIVLLPAVVALIHPAYTYQFDEWLYRGLVFLVISCPCALVISIPLGYFGGIGAASRQGILFKGGNYLDAITRVNTVVFDKTGTLTTGRFDVSAVHTQQFAKDELLHLLLSVEQKSTHPVAQAIVRYALQAGAKASEVRNVREIAGYGLEAEVDGQHVLAGRMRLLTDRKIAVPEILIEAASTCVACAVNGQYAGHLLLSDMLKEDAVLAISRLKELHIPQIQLLSGDKQEIVRIFAGKLGIEQAYGDLLPQDKATYLRQLQAQAGASVAFVGDGMNDAPVLALSEVGIAMGGLGSDAAIESADVVIQTDQPSKVATAISIGRATRMIITQNIVGAIGAKGVILLAGAFGFASLWAAVFADVGVALLAVLNSVRILNKKF